VTGRYGVIDVGTNTVRLLAVAVSDDGVQVLDEFGEVTRLGGALHRSGLIAPEDAARTLACLTVCVERARRAGVGLLDIIGTEVFRRATNGPVVAADFSRALGHLVRVIDGEEEAEASYLGALFWDEVDAAPGPAIVIDVGGGSSEVILGEGAVLFETRSLPIGALTLTEEALPGDPPGLAPLEAARLGLARRLDPLVSVKAALTALASRSPARQAGRRSDGGPGVRVHAVGGTACAVGAWVHNVVPYVAREVQGRWVDRGALGRAILDWSTMTIEDRRLRGRMSEGRARVLPAGALLLDALLEALGCPGFRVSTYGLRHGTILRRLLAS
jgi:exopolyphosphatase/guanosine-5'-triphosphate,3'-diphosphate pyrophosphatase